MPLEQRGWVNARATLPPCTVEVARLSAAGESLRAPMGSGAAPVISEIRQELRRMCNGFPRLIRLTRTRLFCDPAHGFCRCARKREDVWAMALIPNCIWTISSPRAHSTFAGTIAAVLAGPSENHGFLILTSRFGGGARIWDTGNWHVPFEIGDDDGR
jgi:hypothetical protein